MRHADVDHRPVLSDLVCPVGNRFALRHGWEIVNVDPVDRKSTRLNSSHLVISYAVFCLKKKKIPELELPGSAASPAHSSLLLSVCPRPAAPQPRSPPRASCLLLSCLFFFFFFFQ